MTAKSSIGSAASLAIAACVALAAGCESESQPLFEPAVASISVNAFHREPGSVDVVLTNPGGANLRVRRVTMAYRSADDPPDAFQPAPEIVLDGSGTMYSGRLPPLGLGEYELHVTAVFGPRPGPSQAPAPDVVKTRQRSFSVVPGGICFTFDSPGEVSQWSMDGFVDHETGETLCPGALLRTPIGGGSASVPVSSSCMPPRDEGRYRFDLVSPDLSAQQHWQPDSLSGAFVSAAAMPPSRLQAIVVTDADRSFAAIENGESEFAEISSGSVFQGASLIFGELPQDQAIVRLRVRVFGDIADGRATSEGFFHLTTVCPLP